MTTVEINQTRWLNVTSHCKLNDSVIAAVVLAPPPQVSLYYGYVLRQNKLLPKGVRLRHKSCYQSLISFNLPLLLGGIFRHSPQVLQILIDLLQEWDRAETIIGCRQFSSLSLRKYTSLE